MTPFEGGTLNTTAMPLAGYDLAWEWMHRSPRHDMQDADGWHAPDGISWVWEVARLDWDYIMAFCLEVRTHDKTSDHLFIVQFHAPGDYPDHDLHVEWDNHPITFPGVPRHYEQDAVERWVDWAYNIRNRTLF